MKRPSLNSLVKWAIVLATLVFVSKTFYDNWQKVSSLNIDRQGWFYAGIALGITLASHVCQGIIWGWLLRDLGRPMPWRWCLSVFLVLDLAKYLPGDIWHLFGRIRLAHQEAKIPVEIGTTSVFLEPTIIAAAGMALALLSTPHPYIQGLGGFSLVCILIGIHPPIFERVLNGLAQIQKSPLIRRLFHWFKGQRRSRPIRLRRYPLGAVVTAFMLMGLRCLSFLLIVAIFGNLELATFLPIAGGFGFAWMLGSSLPGLPGGVGIFEATAIALLSSTLSPGVLLATIGVYRVISILTEIVGSGLGWLIKGKYHLGLRQILEGRQG